ncbi:cilia- and flagella-associated protein 157 [Bombus huntii]|uniref:cilia- and flagella-associated protein 157 n=1 Tax=Bombus huntii TaxID=85661 RepID=UPI0021AA4CB0|nr:cilia- and flagella-associated protein 157 [Bombus huntii]
MQRARRKKSKSKKKKVKKKCIDERETLSYEQEILDNNRQLARLRSRNEELEEQAELAKEKFRQLEEDRSDVIAHLKRSLEEKIEESKELSERLTALEELRKDELAAYKKKEEAMDNEYRTMENNLSAEVKLAAGKLNALEDWRLARLDLLQKFEKQEQEMAEQEKRHKEELYEAEKSVVVGKSVMQKEMKEHLQILSERLLKAVTLRITEVMNRAIHENVALNRDLDKLLKTNRELDAINIESKKTEQTLRLKCELFETETQIILNKTLKQRHAIHQVVEEYESLIMYYGQVQRSNVRLKQLQSILENIIKRKDALLDKEMKQYEKNILMARNENKRLVKLIQNKEKELDALKTILNTATTFLNEALQVTEKAYNNQQCLGKMAPKLLQSLMEILQTETIISAVDYSPSEIDNIDCKYTLGCLGLIEPIKEGKVAKKEKNDIQEEVQEGESLKDLECIPSCLLSDISSSVCSPKE